jgi:hypothetical protein
MTPGRAQPVSGREADTQKMARRALAGLLGWNERTFRRYAGPSAHQKKAIVAGATHRQELQRRQHVSSWYTRDG